MRIGIGQLWQETNTFNPVATTREDFEQFGVLHGGEIIEQLADTNELGGFIQSLRAWPENPEIVGLVRLPAWPSGLATAETFDWMRDELLAAICAAGPLEGLLLALHGSMAAAGHPDVEGDILAAVRDVVGPRLPIVATLDLHANITERMVREADALVLFHTAPHVDVFETGQRGAAVLRKLLVDGARPATAFQKIPCVLPAERANTELGQGLSWELKQLVQQIEQTPGVLAAGLATVQPWLDVPEFGSAVVVVTDNDPQLAKTKCAEVADQLWQRRQEYLPDLVPVGEAVRRAHEVAAGLVVLGDGADATTSGAPGDSTAILAELVKYTWRAPALAAIVSPETVALAERQGLGDKLTTTIGGVRDNRFSQPLEITGIIEWLFDAKFVISGHLAKNLAIDMGRAVVIRLGTVRLVVTSRSGPHFSPELFRAAGLDPFGAAVLAAKSPCGFRAAYGDRAAQIMHVASPGCAPSDFWKYPYQNIHRPLWPWDKIGDWRAAPRIVRRG